MSTTAKNPDSTPIPVQLSEPEFNAFIFPHLSMPKRGPKCKLGYHRLFNLILWVLYTGMPRKCLPIPKDVTGKPAIHDTNVYRVFAKKKLDVSVLHGDGTNTVAKKGGMASGTLGINTRRARKSSRSQTTMAMCYRPFPSLQSMKRLWCCYLMD